jgi:hypothetical protein
VTRASVATMPMLSTVEKCDRRTGPWAHATGDSISAPQVTANAAITATTQRESIIEPGSAKVSSRVTAPLSHRTPLARLASAISPGVAACSPSHDDISSRNLGNETSTQSPHVRPFD